MTINSARLSGSFAAGFGSGCSWSGTQRASFTISWKGDFDGTIGDTAYDGRASFSPSAVTYTGEQVVTDPSDGEGLALPGVAQGSTVTGSFAASSTGDRSATLYATSTPSALSAQCQQKGGVKGLELSGAITVGAGPIDSQSITTGPDGALWFTNVLGAGRLSTGGVFSSYTDPDDVYPTSITTGPDGNLWFTNALGGTLNVVSSSSVEAGSIGRLAPSGDLTIYQDPSLAFPQSITTGPDGALWFTNPGDATIGRISTAGVITSFPDPSVDANPTSITTGPDGNLWFTNLGSNSIGRMTTSGAVTLFYSDPNINGPVDITTGPDGNLWFTNSGNNTIGTITPAGVATSYSDSSINAPFDITSGPDGALWFTNTGSDFTVLPGSSTISTLRGEISAGTRHETRSLPRRRIITIPTPSGGSIGRITTSGVVTNYTDPGIDGPEGITTGPDGALWFTNITGSIGRITTSGAVSGFPSS